MDNEKIKEILEKVYNHEKTPEQALNEFKFLPFYDLGHTKIDFHRKLRINLEEVIFGKNKSKEELYEIINEFRKNSHNVLVTKLQEEKGEFLKEKFPEGKFFAKSGIFKISGKKERKGLIAVISAGTSDIPVAEEAAITAEFFGSKVEKIYDVGVAGLHRLLEYKEIILKSNIIVAVAGMEGALPSVIAGIFGKPLVAVPTSVGYGASFNGISALLTMLNSCAPGVVVVNIDNGFGAGVFAHMINFKNFS